MMVRTVALKKVYGQHAALSDVDLDVAAGSVYGLVGPNGAGKTTLLSILAGLRIATSGDVMLDAPRRQDRGPARYAAFRAVAYRPGGGVARGSVGRR